MSDSVNSFTTHIGTRAAAAALGVSESSLKRWADQGILEAVKTPGGHRRVSVASIVRFAQQSGHSLHLKDTPELERAKRSLGAARRDLLRALLEDRADAVSAILLEQQRAGIRVDRSCDELLAPALAELGARWHAGKAAIYQERRACQLVQRALLELIQRLPQVPGPAPLALGCALADDPYELPTAMAEAVLRDRGFDARSMGAGLPASTLESALRERRPRLAWVSLGCFVDEEATLRELERCAETAAEVGAAFAIGGRALTPALRRRLRHATCCDTMGHLAALATAMVPQLSR